MKNNLLAAVLVFGFGSSALAAPPNPANEGTVNVKGSVSSTVSIAFDSADITNAGTGATGANAAGTAAGSALQYTLDFKDVASTGTGADSVRSAVVNFLLRSNAGYSLNVQQVNPAATSGVLPSDIGFAILSAEGTGALVEGGTGRKTSASSPVDIIDPAFDQDNASAAAVVNGEGNFEGDLGDITAAPKKVLSSTTRISNRGSFNSPNNALKVATQFAILPQYFATTTAFDYQVKFTVTTP